MIESKVLETRLILKENSFVGSSVSKCANRFKTIISNKSKAIIEKSSATSDELDVSLDCFMREISHYELDINKADQTQCAYKNQFDCYDTVEANVRQKILATEKNLLDLEQDFKNQKLIRSHREELEKKAIIVNALPSRNYLKRKIDVIENSLQSLDESLQTANQSINSRHKQFLHLLQSISDLQNKLVVEENEMNIHDLISSESNSNADEDQEEDVRDRDADRDEIDLNNNNHKSPEINEDEETNNDMVDADDNTNAPDTLMNEVSHSELGSEASV